MQSSPLTKTAFIVVILFLAFAGLYYAKPFLVPVAIAGILSMLFLPMSRWFEAHNIHRGVAIVICILLLVLFFAGIGALLAWQISDLSQDAANMEKNITSSIDKAKQALSNTLGISPEKQQEMMKKQQSSGGGGMTNIVTGVMSSIMGIAVDTLLVLVYIFLFMFYRTRIKNFILKLVRVEEKPKTTKIIDDSSRVAFKYLSGLGFMIVLLWIMYGIGFSIAGVKNALFFAVLCGVLEIIPFVGNISGTALTMLMGLTQGGGSNIIIGILITYVLVQFIQTYILEPLVVGAEVNLNPLATILVIVLGETVWGVPGMILAVPMLGITKIICDNVEPLKPFGYLIGEEKKKKSPGFIDKVKGWFK
jgi:predicted PurR-regulated permease PerM